MSRKPLYLIIAALCILLGACNKDSNAVGDVVATESTAIVSSFSLSKNRKVLPGLDSVFFSIDLQTLRVFNADSLPYGTKVNKLVPVIGTQGCSVAELTVKRAGLPDTVYNYLTNSTDSIDFTYPVKLHLVSADGVTATDFSIFVNVHKMKPDSLYFNRAARRELPSTFANPSQQRTVARGSTIYCLTAFSGRYSLATAQNPSEEWDVNEITLPFTPDIESLSATESALYMLDDNHQLWRSPNGLDWVNTGTAMECVIGGYNDILLGLVKRSGSYFHATYPASAETPVDSDFPVEGFSDLVTFQTQWGTNAQAFTIGGCKADGTLTGAMWGYDGSQWAKISNTTPPAAQGRSLICYTTFVTDSTNWSTKAYPTLMALGGLDSANKPTKEVYLSLDMGMNWHLADPLMQLPAYIPAMSGSQALVRSTTLSSRASGEWIETPVTPLPAWWAIAGGVSSRAIYPITEWDCPYIYLFGGYGASGSLYNTVWRGAINRLTFKPLQ